MPLRDHYDQRHIRVMSSACVGGHYQEQACESHHVTCDDDATEDIIFPIKLSILKPRIQLFLVLELRTFLLFLNH